MDVTYNKAAIQAYMESIGQLGVSFRRTMDEGLSQYKACMERFSRVYSVVEEACRKAYNAVEAAESKHRTATTEYETAMRILENSEDESERNTAQNRAAQARQIQAEAEAELDRASAELASNQAKLTQLNALRDQYMPLAESAKNRMEDGMTSFVTVVDRGNRDLNTFMGIMEQAREALYDGNPATAAGSSGGASSGSSGGASSGFSTLPPIRQTTTPSGNSMGVLCSGGQENLVMEIAGTVHTFPCTKSGLAKAHRMAIRSGDTHMISGTESLYRARMNQVDSARDSRWNNEYIPLVQANIRRSVELYFSDYVSDEKLDHSLRTLSFMGQEELARRYGNGFSYGTLGFNDGTSSNIAHDINLPTHDGRVGDIPVAGSGNMKINHGLVTAIHENLHMMSANDTPYEFRRGLMVGNDERARAMNEAFTEFFTFISCGGHTALGGYYPGVYSGYHILMQEMPTIERAVGRDCMMDAYFNNNPQRMRGAIDAILGAGAWDDMCAASNDLLYNGNANNAAARLSGYLKKLSTC